MVGNENIERGSQELWENFNVQVNENSSSDSEFRYTNVSVTITPRGQLS
jgi:hypothetical protein